MRKSPELRPLVGALVALAATMTEIIDTRIGGAMDLRGAHLSTQQLHAA